ncbi:unnamed protein product [Alopecurus aequalis]
MHCGTLHHEIHTKQASSLVHWPEVAGCHGRLRREERSWQPLRRARRRQRLHGRRATQRLQDARHGPWFPPLLFPLCWIPLFLASTSASAPDRTLTGFRAQRWHPDKCAAAGGVEAAKARFQKIQGAYAVLSDPNKRILYDVGVYDGDGDDEGAGEILGDILEAMNKTAPQENGEGESLEDLETQFEELFLRPDAYSRPSKPSSSASSSGQDDAGKSSKIRAGRK